MYRQIHTSIWKKSWFLDLEPQEKLLFVYLFSNDQTHLTGLYELPIRVMAFETGLDLAFVRATLAKFDALGKVHYDYERSLVWVVNLLEHNAENRTSPKIQPHILAQFRNTPDCELRRRAIGHYNGLIPEAYHIDTISIPMPQQADQGAEQRQGQGADTGTETGESEPEAKSQILPAAALPGDGACFADALDALAGYGIDEAKAREITGQCGADWVLAWRDEFIRRGDRVHSPAAMIVSFAAGGTGFPDKPPGNGRDNPGRRSLDGEYGDIIEH